MDPLVPILVVLLPLLVACGVLVWYWRSRQTRKIRGQRHDRRVGDRVRASELVGQHSSEESHNGHIHVDEVYVEGDDEIWRARTHMGDTQPLSQEMLDSIPNKGRRRSDQGA